jgi:hypothetical protein
MPNNLIEQISKEKNVSVEKLEKIWDNAILQAEKNNISNKYAYATAVLEKVVSADMEHTIANDSQRTTDDNEFTRIANCIITSAGVFEYLGREIPNHQSLGLDADQIYKLYRPADEIDKAKDTFKDMPLLDTHLVVYADDIPKSNVIGTLSSDITFDGKDLTCSIVLWDKEAVEQIEAQGKKGLSAGYRYTPVMKNGVHEGQAYDIIMTELSANHVAQVENPRNPSSIINDEKIVLEGAKQVSKKKIALDQETGEGSEFDKIVDMLQNEPELKEKLLKFLTPAEDEDKEEEKKEAEDDVEYIGGEKGEYKYKVKKEDKDDKKTAMDSNSLKLLIKNEVNKQLREYNEAIELCEKHIGVINRTAFDSADALYDKVLKDNKIAFDGLDTKAKKVAVSVLGINKKELTKLTYDSNSILDLETALKERGL